MVGEVEVDAEVRVGGPGAVEVHGGEVEQDVDRPGQDGVLADRRKDARGDAFPEFLGCGEVDVPPLRAFGLIAELLVGVGLMSGWAKTNLCRISAAQR